MIVESYEDVIVLSGALRSNFWDTIHTAISLTLKRHPSGVIVDCSGITECTPEGADTFRDAMEFIEGHSARIIVAAVPEGVMEVMKSVPHVRSQLPIAASVEAARRSLDLLLEDEEHAPKRRSQPSSTNPKVLVCLATGTGEAADDAAMVAASRLADSLHTEIILTCVLIVPREQPINAPLPKQEESTGRAIERAHAFYDGKHQLFQTRVERGRDIPAILKSVTDEVEVAVVVLPLNEDPMEAETNAKLVKGVTAKLKEEVIFVRAKV